MAIKGGQILHVAGGDGGTFVIDRIQSGGVSGINVNETRIEELGNYATVGTIRDIPDITFELESYDTTTEIESILTGGDNTEANGTVFNPKNFVPLDVISPFKVSGTDGVGFTVGIPFISLESLSYSMSIGDPATVNASLRGDSVFYAGGGMTLEEFNGDGTAGPFNFTDGPADVTVISGTNYYALGVAVETSPGVWERQFQGTHYTDTATGITFTAGNEPAIGTGNIKVMYAHQTAQTFDSGTVHATSAPAAVRGADIFVTTDGNNWLGVQSASVDWSVSLERDEEFGNKYVVAQDFDTPECSGSITMKPSTVAALWAQIQEVAGTTATAVVNATEDPPEIDLRIKITNPADGTTLKTLQVPKAKFTLPALQGQVGNKLEPDFSFTSADGELLVHKADIV